MIAPGHASVIELSRGALRSNIRFLKSHIGASAVFSSVVKANAYGHGIESYVPLAFGCGVRHFSVFSAVEAFEVNRCLPRPAQVVIMGAVDNDELGWAIQNDVGFFVFDRARLEVAVELASVIGKPAKVHMELETGLYRTGLEAEPLMDCVRIIRDNPRLISLDGVCTHLAGAETVGNYLRIKQQLVLFRRRLASLKRRGLVPTHRHAACSAAAFTFPESTFDLVRFGIAQYGFWPSRETQMQHCARKRLPLSQLQRSEILRRVIKWKSRVMAVKHVPGGQFVSYGTSYLAPCDQRMAVVPVGYAQGFSRRLSNRGHVLIRGRRAQVVGMVNMNMILIDVTAIPNVRPGEEVVILGRQGRDEITVGSFGDMTRDLTYEVLVRLPRDIPRVVVA